MRFEIFVDEGCSLCSRESRWLKTLDRGRGRLRITDIGSRAFRDGDHGLTYEQAMRTIHGRWPDGRVVQGVEVFRSAYDAVGWGGLWSPTRLPLVRDVIDALYRVFARRRYLRRMSQGCPLPPIDGRPVPQAVTADRRKGQC